ncbi:MAG: SH3 domain-containing protein [Desulfobacteraceae bacterium]|nr:MAG: SH3 domain-containing protein [Desulfobacteraceae bacterium]
MFRVSPPFELKKLGTIFKYKVLKMLLNKGKITKVMIAMLSTWKYSGFHVFYGNRIAPLFFDAQYPLTIKNIPHIFSSTERNTLSIPSQYLINKIGSCCSKSGRIQLSNPGTNRRSIMNTPNGFHFRWRQLLIMAVALSLLMAQAVASQMMSVQVKSGQARKSPTFLGPVIADFAYGDRVQILTQQGAWYQVALPSGKGQGWMHMSALTEKKIVLKAGAKDVSQAASSDELALAGKGFNKQVENQYRTRNPNLDFRQIDQMEALTVSQAEIQGFIQDGRLTAKGGAQ